MSNDSREGSVEASTPKIPGTEGELMTVTESDKRGPDQEEVTHER